MEGRTLVNQNQSKHRRKVHKLPGNQGVISISVRAARFLRDHIAQPPPALLIRKIKTKIREILTASYSTLEWVWRGGKRVGTGNQGFLHLPFQDAAFPKVQNQSPQVNEPLPHW